MNNLNLEFVNKFQQLEKLVKTLSNSGDETRFIDALNRVADNNKYIKNNRGLFEDINALRNVFSHRERAKYVANVNKFALNELEKIIESLKNPPTVISKYGCSVYQVSNNNEISQVMKVMTEKTYTHIPVWKEYYLDGFNDFVGVFSYTSFFGWLTDRLEQEDNPTFVKRFFNDINPKYLHSPVVNYDFIPENKSVYEIPVIFEKNTASHKRFDCLLITPNGIRGEKITGIITSWDLGSI